MMTNIELLKRYSIFQPLSEPELEKMAKVAEEKRYSRHQVIFNQGEKGGNLYFIKQGTVEISLPLNDSGRYKRMALLKEGEYFGELSFLDGREHSARATASEDVELLVLNNKNYQRAIRKDKKEETEMQIRIILKVVGLLRNMNRRYSLRPFA
jgi:CRP-like cAMP-binding protein